MTEKAKWPPTKAEVKRLQEIEKQYEATRRAQELAVFIEEFGKMLVTLATHTPTERWPGEFYSAFQAAARRHPELAKMYKQYHEEFFKNV